MKNVAALGFHAAAYSHRSEPLCKPQHDLATFRSSCGSSTGSVAPDQCIVNSVSSSAVHNAIDNSLKNLVQHQLTSARFPSSSFCVSSMSGGVVYDALPLLPTALTPLPAVSHNQIPAIHDVTPITTVEVSKQAESSNSVSSLTMVRDQALLTQASDAKQSGSAACKAFDVYEFRDEDECELAGVGVSFRKGMPSRSAAKSTLHSPRYRSVNSQQTRVHDLTGEHRSEADTGLISAQRNVAMIFDMDSKSIHRISLPVKTEPCLNKLHPESVPQKAVDSTSLHVTCPTSHLSLQNSAVHVARGKYSMPDNDVKWKRVRLNSYTSSYPVFENRTTGNNCFSDIPGLISTVRHMSRCDGSSMMLDRWREKPGLLQPSNPVGEQKSVLSALRNVTCPDQKITVKSVDVSTRSHVTNTSCNEVVKCQNEPSSFVPTCQFPSAPQSAQSPHLWLANGQPAGTVNNLCKMGNSKPISVSGQSVCMSYAGPDYHRYGIHPQNSGVPVKPQPVSCQEEMGKFESSWWHVAKADHPNAVRSNYVEQNTFRNVSSEGCKQYYTAGENLQHDALSCALDLSHTGSSSSQMSPSTSVITHNQGFHPNLPTAAAASRNIASRVEQTVTNSCFSHLPREHHSQNHVLQQQQQQQQQQLALSVKKEAIVEENRMMTDDEEKLMNRLKCNLFEEVPRCYCRGLPHTINDLFCFAVVT